MVAEQAAEMAPAQEADRRGDGGDRQITGAKQGRRVPQPDLSHEGHRRNAKRVSELAGKGGSTHEGATREALEGVTVAGPIEHPAARSSR